MVMALRPIANALPTTLEMMNTWLHFRQPLKSPLITFPPKISNPFPNVYPLNVTINFESLKYQSSIEGLDSKDWTKVCESLNNARHFALFHSAILAPTLDKVMAVVVKSIKNPRSALIKTSIMASADIFNVFGDSLLD